MEKLKVFVVDDENIARVTLSDDLKDLGYLVDDYDNPLLALIDINKKKPDIIFTDVRMPEMNGIEFLKEIKKINPNTYVIIMTGYSSVSNAVDAVKSGAYDYISKPINIQDIKIKLEQIDKIENLKRDYKTVIYQFSENYNLQKIIGTSDATKSVIESIKKVSPTDTTVLIQGETGTGKELIANVIHYNSKRNEKPFVKLSCAALSREIFESELFGHTKGAFTGAIKEKKGRFELANNGTLYLDDVDDIPLDLQVKLLRVLEENEFEKVGGEQTIKVNVRIIASTKKNLKELADNGLFRHDLYYRLNVYPIFLKPLRERISDIKELFFHFVNQYISLNNIKIQEEVFEILQRYSWPGNVRELKHLVERLLLISEDKIIKADILPYEIKNSETIFIPYDPQIESLDEYLYQVEKNILLQSLKKSGGNKSKAAEMLKIPYSTLRTKLEKFGLT